MPLLWEPGHFLVWIFVTVIIGGGAAYLSGRGQALLWRPVTMTVLYMIPLACAVRFFHYALFQGELLSIHYLLVDMVVLIAFALLGYRKTFTDKMVSQYPWLYERAGPLAWKRKSAT